MRNSYFLFFLFGIIFYFSSCGGGSNRTGRDSEVNYDELIKIKQYSSAGRKLYEGNCANCHQADGEGLANLYPPVKNSDYLKNNLETSVCGIKYGMKGEIIVNGKSFSQEMPANDLLTELEIAEIMTYIMYELNDSAVLVSHKNVRQILKSCQNQE